MKKHSRHGPKELNEYLDPALVAFFSVTSRDEAVTELIDVLDDDHKLQDREAFHQAILQREKIVSTGIGIGVAIPHAKLNGYDDFFIAIGVQKDGGIEWKSLDGLPVRIVFMIGGPEDRQTEYLSILSMITTAVKEPERRKQLLQARTPEEVIAVFENQGEPDGSEN